MDSTIHSQLKPQPGSGTFPKAPKVIRTPTSAEFNCRGHGQCQHKGIVRSKASSQELAVLLRAVDATCPALAN